MAQARTVSSLLHVDGKLSQLFESAEWLPCLPYIDELQRTRPELGAERHFIAGGWAMFAGQDSPISHAIGLGLSAPVTSGEIDRVEDIYRGRQSYCEFVVSPYADMSLVAELGKRGYAITEWNSVLVRPLDSVPELNAASVEIRPTRAEQARAWAEIVAAGFADLVKVDPEIFIPFATAPNSICYLAFVDGEPAGGGGGSVFPEEGIAPIFGASTLPRFRGRGVQGGLLRARLRAAAEAGCRYAVISTFPGTVSQRNAERNGFRAAYTKCAMQRRF